MSQLSLSPVRISKSQHYLWRSQACPLCSTATLAGSPCFPAGISSRLGSSFVGAFAVLDTQNPESIKALRNQQVPTSPALPDQDWATGKPQQPLLTFNTWHHLPPSLVLLPTVMAHAGPLPAPWIDATGRTSLNPNPSSTCPALSCSAAHPSPLRASSEHCSHLGPNSTLAWVSATPEALAPLPQGQYWRAAGPRA